MGIFELMIRQTRIMNTCSCLSQRDMTRLVNLVTFWSCIVKVTA